jgi:hypothetical protein
VPPHDCRITARCFRHCFGFRVEPPYDFEAYASENSVIETFFAKRRNDENGGEGGELIKSVKTRPVFSLHVGKTRAATWFERDRPPQGIVWLLGAEDHDERHKGKTDAYDRFAALDQAGELFPAAVDYKLLELSRRQRDTADFEEVGSRDAENLLREVIAKGRSQGTVSEIPVRMALTAEDDPLIVAVAVSTRPIVGRLTGYSFPLTHERFLLVAKIVENTATRLAGVALAEAPRFDFPGGLVEERGFLVAFARPS